MQPFATRWLVSTCVLVCALLIWQISFRLAGARAQSTPLVAFAVSAATLKADPLAPDSLVSLFGSKLATTTAVATDTDPNQAGVQLPYSLGGSTVRVNGQLAQVLFVSPQQINFLLPESRGSLLTYSGWEIQVQASDGTLSNGSANSADIAPGVFTANGSGKGLPAGTVLRVRADGTRVNEPLFTVENGVIVPRPLDFGAATDQLFLTLFTTGLRNAPDPNRDGNLNEGVRLLANGYETTPSFVGVAPGFPGVEQINWEVPRSFLGQTRLQLAFEINGTPAAAQELDVPLAVPPLGAVAWRAAGLNGKRITSLLSTSSAALAGTEEGIYRTATATNAWRLVNYAIPDSVPRITAFIHIPNFNFTIPLLLAGVENGGTILTASSESGEFWVNVGIAIFPILNGKKVRAFAANATHIFAGGDDLSVARFRCCNEPWQQAGPVFAPRVNALAANGPRIFAGTAANGLFVSNDNGDNWAQNNGGIPVTADIRALLRPAGNLVLAGTTGGLYRSTDNGASWAHVTDGLAANATINAFLAYGATLLAGTAEGVLVSTDGGVRWQGLSTGLTNPNVLALAADGPRLLAGTTTGLFEATIIANVNRVPLAESQTLTLNEDTTKSLTLRGSDPDGDALSYNVVRGPAHGYLRGMGANLVYVPDENYFGEDQFEFRANDGKLGSVATTVRLTINPVNDPPQIEISGERLLLVGQFSSLTLALSDPDLVREVLIPTQLKLTATGLPEGASISAPGTIRGTTDLRRLLWVPTAPGNYTINFTLTDDATPPLSVSQTVTLRVADNPEKGVWTQVNSPTPPPRTDLIHNLFADGNDLYAVTAKPAELGGRVTTGMFWRSTDGGTNWQPADNGLQGVVTAFARQGNLLFVVATDRIFRTPVPNASGAFNWTPVNNGLPASVSIIGLAANADRLAAITPFAVFLTTNQGNNWTNISGNLPFPPQSDQTIYIFPRATSVTYSGDALFVSFINPFPSILSANTVLNSEALEVAYAAAEKADQVASDTANLIADAPTEGVFRSTDNGLTWTPVNSGLGLLLPNTNQRRYYVSNLTVSGGALYANGSLGLFRSTNQGERWQRVPTPPFNSYIVTTTPFPLGKLGETILPAWQAAETHSPLNQTLPLITSTTLPPVVTGGKLYQGFFGGGIYTSRDDGSDWVPINQGLDEPYPSQLVLVGNRLYLLLASFPVLDGLPVQPTTRIFTRNLATQ